jgi:hypothetical protein
MASIMSLMLLSTNAIYADSYQHFRNDTPFQLQLKPDETIFINNNSGKLNQLTVSLPNGTAKITDSSVGNNGATSYTVHDVGTYTFYGKDGVIGVAVVSAPIIPQETIVINAQNNSTNSTVTENATVQQNIPQSLPETVGQITPQNNTNNSTPLQLGVQNKTTVTQTVPAGLSANVTQLQQEVQELKQDNADLKAIIIAQNNQTNTMLNVIHGMLFQLLRHYNLQ